MLNSEKMFNAVVPKLPMRNQSITRQFYIDRLGFRQLGNNYPDYLMLTKDHIEIHFFEFAGLDPKENDGQIYIRVQNIHELYQSFIHQHIAIHPAAHLQIKTWGQIEFSILDPDHNLLTFGQPSAEPVA